MGRAASALYAQASAMREFNRFYTRQAGLLQEGLLKSDFTLTEARVLYELANGSGSTAADIGRELGLDAGYLSRILKRFAARGYLDRARAEHDGRQSLLTLTPDGHAAYKPIHEESQALFTAMLERLSGAERERLLSAMSAIRALLDEPKKDLPPFVLRPHRPGDIAWAVSRQAALYHEEFGWDGSFEAMVTGIGADFITNFDPERERCWIAERDGAPVGSVFLVRQSEEVAKLRMLYVDVSARGLGIGSRLVEECIAFARGKGYRTLTLWTNDILLSARKIYEAAGFTLVREQPHHSFGVDLVGQYWELDL